MKTVFKSLFLIFLGCSFCFISCGDADTEELKGIQVVTSRSNVQTDGVGIACNFSTLIEEQFTEENFKEILEDARKEIEEDEEFSAEEFDEFFNLDNFDEVFELIFGSISGKTFYTITAGEVFDLEFDEEIGAAGEGFSISWVVDADEPAPGVYEAKGVKFNIEDPEDLENGAEFSVGDITVTIAELTDEDMIGTFEGTVTNKEGVDEVFSGEFNVERASCTE